MTFGDFARSLAGRLERSGIAAAEARLDAELLLRHALGWDRARFITAAHDDAPEGLATGVEPAVARRAAREPMAHVLGQCEFWGLTFEVTPDVLIPRPETEILVEQALQRADAPRGSEAPAILDAGTGSGCIAVSLAVARPQARILATDTSAAALRVAQRNAARHGVLERVSFLQADLLGDTPGALEIVVSNPPYVPVRDRGTLPAEVRDHEPPLALFGGEDGLDVIRRLVAVAAKRLNPGGWLLFEFGFGQDAAVHALMTSSPVWTDVTLTNDLQGIPRVSAARRR